MSQKSDNATIQALAILGKADAALLLAVIGRLPDDNDGRVVVKNGRFRLPITTANQIRRQLHQENPQQYHQLLEKAVAACLHRLRDGDQTIEPIFAPLLEQAAAEMLANDTPALIALVDAVQSVTFTTNAVQQRARYLTAVSHFKQNQYDAAINHFNALLHLPNLEPILKARSLNGRSVVYRDMGQLENALAGYEASLMIWKALDNPYNEAMVHMNMGTIELELDNYHLAEACLRQAEKIFAANNFFNWVAIVQNKLGELCLQTGRLEEALAYFRQFITQWRAKNANKDIRSRTWAIRPTITTFQTVS